MLHFQFDGDVLAVRARPLVLARQKGLTVARLLAPMLVITVGGKVLGLGREVLISSTYGTSGTADLFFGLQQIPLVVSTFMFGAFALAFVPHHAAAERAGQPARFVRPVVAWILLLDGLAAVAFAVGGIVAGHAATAPAGSGSGPPIGTFAAILALSLVPIAVAGLAYGICVAQQRHLKATFLAALAPGVMLLGLVGMRVARTDPVISLPLSFTLGWFVAASIALPVVWRPLFHDRAASPIVETGRPAMRPFLTDVGLSAVENVGFSLTQSATVAAAASVGPGWVAVNAYASRTAMLALSGIMGPVNQVLAGRFAQGRTRRGATAVSLGGAWLLAIGIGIGIVLTGRLIVDLVYVRGAFGSADGLRVASALTPYAALFAVMAANQAAARYLFAGDLGGRYAAVMLAAYVLEMPLIFAVAGRGLEAIVWVSVVCEGAAFVVSLLQIVRVETRCAAS